MLDHLVHFEHIDTPYPYSADGKPPSFTSETVWPESWSTCSALAARTSRLQFVTNVYIVPLRHPVELAKATSSAAYFSGGRLCLGAGARYCARCSRPPHACRHHCGCRRPRSRRALPAVPPPSSFPGGGGPWQRSRHLQPASPGGPLAAMPGRLPSPR